MTKRMILMTTASVLAIALTSYAGDGVQMKCKAKPEKDQKSKPCGYETRVVFGGGMMFQQITGYCRKCQKIVYLSWTRELSPEMLKNFGIKEVKPQPKPLGEVWDAKTGKVITVHACPTCKGPFMEVKSPKDFKHCPSCNKPHFEIDENAPRMAID